MFQPAPREACTSMTGHHDCAQPSISLAPSTPSPARWAAEQGAARRAGGTCRGGEGCGQRLGPGWAAGLSVASLEGERGGRGAMKLLQPKLGRYCMLQQILQIMILSQALLRIANLFNSLIHITTDYCIITHPLLQNYYNITANCVDCSAITTYCYKITYSLLHYYYTITSNCV
jgi:hypothetical protein